MASLVAIFWLVTALIGYVVFGFYDRSDYTFYNVYPSDAHCVSGVMAHIVSAAGIYAGYYLSISKNGFNVKPIGMILNEFSGFSEKSFVIKLNIVVLIISIASHIATYGFYDLFSRDYYIPDHGGVAPVLSQLSAIIGLILSSLVIGSSNLKNKITGVILSAIFVLLMFSKGSRFSVAGLLLAMVIPVLSSSGGVFGYKKLTFYVFIALAIVPLLHVVLYFRSDSIYGLIIYLQKFGEAMSTLPDNEFQSVWDILFNLTFSVPVTEVTINGLNDLSTIFVALNPAPGEMAGWYDIAGSRRVSVDIPFSAMGELYGFSPIFCFIYMMIIGYFITYVQFESENMMPMARFVGLISAMSLGMLFAILAPQYPLRNITRLAYYMLAVFFLIRIFDALQKNKIYYKI